GRRKSVVHIACENHWRNKVINIDDFRELTLQEIGEAIKS
ncbi:unnamed protein product, partial [marine sediment metagenome]